LNQNQAEEKRREEEGLGGKEKKLKSEGAKKTDDSEE
jgi:hypothetical protein